MLEIECKKCTNNTGSKCMIYGDKADDAVKNCANDGFCNYTKRMDFKEAYEALKQGAKIKRQHWRGYWMKENGTITMHCKDGSVIPFTETEDIFVNLDNIVADDWELLEDCDVKELNITTFTFGEALSNLKRGKKVARKGWNGKGMFVVYQKGYPQGIACNKQTAEAWGINEGDNFVCNPYLQISCTDGSHSMWVPSINDCLAEDWMLV